SQHRGGMGVQVIALPNFCFSSRRRHTRSKRDWSSDVCSSDLLGAFDLDALPPDLPHRAVRDDHRADLPDGFEADADAGADRGKRSEERRVGKECENAGVRKELTKE